jgi:hypothetical protein
MTHNTRERIEDWKEEFWYKIAEWNTAQPEDIDIYANQLEMFIEYHIRERVHQELQKAREQRKGWKGYLVVDPETDNYTYSDVYLNRIDAEKWLKANGISGLRIIEVDVYQSELDQPITSDRRDEEAHAERCEGKY